MLCILIYFKIIWPIFSPKFRIFTENKKLLRNFLGQKVDKIQETFKAMWVLKFFIKNECTPNFPVYPSLSVRVSLCILLGVYICACVLYWLCVCVWLCLMLTVCVAYSVSVIESEYQYLCSGVQVCSVSLFSSVLLSSCGCWWLSIFLSVCLHLWVSVRCSLLVLVSESVWGF